MTNYIVDVSSGTNTMRIETTNGESEFNYQLGMSSPGDIVTLYRIDGSSEFIVAEGYGA